MFPYSERDGTPAARIPNQVHVPVRKERAAALRALGEKQVESLLRRNAGKDFNVLVEKGAVGRAENFLSVILPQDLPVGSLVNVRTLKVDKSALLSEII